MSGALGLLQLRLGDHLVQIGGDRDVARLQSAVALLRTLFEDHYVDPEHQSCLFFNGCMIAGPQQRSHDFTVVHRGGRVMLSEFTFPWRGPGCVSLPLSVYAREVVRFGAWVLATGIKPEARPDWQDRYLNAQWKYLRTLTDLGRRFVKAEAGAHADFCAEYQELHGRLKRPLDLQVLEVIEQGAPREPVTILARIMFGPLRAKEVLPMRLNQGDVILVTAEGFTNTGVVLTLEGVGSCGVRPGDRIYGLQLFYP